ncbi:MAG: hypothetical protein RLZZ292_1726 [Bacteroidota bacterium]|jgi:gliding motility-associated-like protein
MFQRLLVFTTFLILTHTLHAQVPVPVSFEGELRGSPTNGLRVACTNNAGTCTQKLVVGAQSDNKLFLCKNDKLDITHKQDFDLSGDPIPATFAGIGYANYKCAPTVAGMDLAAVTADPCIYSTAGKILVFATSLNGNEEFKNDGGVQTFFNAGKPVKIFYAPITYDKGTPLANGNYDIVYESTGGGPQGPCVNVSTTNAFSVVYLNEIKANILSQIGLNGSFQTTGGLPEFDANATNYTITIALQTDPNIKGNVTSGAAGHNTKVNFSVPQTGTYKVTVKDGHSCEASFLVNMVTALTLTVASDSVRCNGEANGKIIINGAGGKALYSYKWKEPGSAVINGPINMAGSLDSISNLKAGNYSITLTDADGMIISKTIQVFQPDPFSVTLAETQLKCFGDLNGSITATPSGGTVPYSYKWTGALNTKTITNLSAGNYTLTTTDAHGCTATKIGTIGANQMTIAKNVTDATCTGKKDGTITITPSGGTTVNGNYTFTWEGAFVETAKKSTLANIGVGVYSLTLTDDNGCMVKDSFLIAAQKELKLNVSIDNVKCFGSANGEIKVTGVTLGNTAALPYTFTWDTGTPTNTPTSSTVPNVTAGKYSVTMSDNDPAGCEVTGTYTVTQPDSLKLSVTKTDETCSKGKDGTITVKVSGGTLNAGSSYKYKWSKTPSTQATAIDLASDTYKVTVTDDNGCSATISAFIDIPKGPVVTIGKVVDVACSDSKNGSIEVKTTANVNFSWDKSILNVSTLSDLAPGWYHVTVTDKVTSCSTVDSAQVKSPAPISSDTTLTNISCPGFDDGQITLTPKGGTAPYTYTWSQPTLTGQVVTALKAGSYTVTVSDKNNCKGLVLNLNLVEPPKIAIQFANVQGVSCYGSINCDGKATAVASNGQGPFSYIWQNAANETTASATQLCQGKQTVIAFDGICSAQDTVFVPSPAELKVDDTNTLITQVSCFGKTDGLISVKAQGGTLPYSYAWSNAATTSVIDNLSAKDYTVTITDGNNCSIIHSAYKIIEPLPLDAAIVEDTSVIKCAGRNNAKLAVKLSGGNAAAGPALYQWTPTGLSTTDKATDLGGGTYSVTVTDVKGCTATTQAIVNFPPAVKFEISPIIDPLCYGYQTAVKILNASGGNGTNASIYTFSLDDGVTTVVGDSVSAYAGEHLIRVYDFTGECFSEQKIEINEPAPLQVSLGVDISVPLGESVQLVPIITSVIPLDTTSFKWDISTYLTCSDCRNPYTAPTDPITYTFTVKDLNGCIGKDDIFVDSDKNRNVYIPNAFSANDDGTNDAFQIFTGTGVKSINYARVFDRWGNMMVDVNLSALPSPIPPGDQRIWDGRYKGKKANQGVYVYVFEVEFVDGIKLIYRGDFALLR